LMHEQFRLREIEVELECSDELLVIGNSIQLEQVFINLLTNARDAVANSERKLIKISCRIDSGKAIMTFNDTGPGIPKGLEKKIFDPFFTTKEVGAGTGLGLSITYGIIKEHQGMIWVENHPGQGATFVIKLPLADDQQAGIKESFIQGNKV
jgi:signal transduction histidine kinase